MDKFLIHNAVVLTLNENFDILSPGNVWVENKEITRVWEGDTEIPAGIRVVDGRGLIVMPGLVNTHGHVAMTLLRGYADDLPLMRWLEEKIWPVEDRLTGEDVYWGTMLGIVEMLKSGTTTCTDMYFFMERAAGAVEESGIRAVLSRGLVGINENSYRALKETRELIDRWNGGSGGRISVILGPHAPYTCPPPFLKKVMDLSEETGLPMQIHVAETRGEVENCRKEHGVTPVELLDRIGFLDHPVIAAHCVHLIPHDMEILAQKGIRVAHNPVSNLKLGSGLAPVAELLRRGVMVGLGTDGASSNNNLDLFEEMRVAALLPKGIAEEPTLLPARQALEMATRQGAGVLFLDNLGAIKEGYRADIIGVNYKQPHFTPLHDAAAHLVYSASGKDVDMVMVDGKLLMEKGKLIGLDEEKITCEAQRRAFALVGKGKNK